VSLDLDLPSIGRILAIDVGDKRIGIALSDPHQVVAHPLTTLTRRQGRRFPLARLREHLDRHTPVAVVVGLPLSSEGTEGERAREARSIGALIHEKAHLPVAYWDERMTTARALSAVRDLGGGTRGRKSEIDRLAATTLLQSFLDARR